jgi:hypothetical protein
VLAIADRHQRADERLLPHRLAPGEDVLAEDRQKQRARRRGAYRPSTELVVHEGVSSGVPSNASRIASKYVLQPRQRIWQVMI